MNQFPIEYAQHLKPKPDPKTLVFGHTFTDHMFLMNYDAGQGWHDGRIVPYGPLRLDQMCIRDRPRPRRPGQGDGPGPAGGICGQ